MVVYNLYLFVDANWVPEIIWLDVVVRVFVVTPLLFLYFPARHYSMLDATGWCWPPRRLERLPLRRILPGCER